MDKILQDKINLFKEIIASSNNVIFFGGAGVSTESGIPDFRSVDGLYNQKYDYPPETILSHSFFVYKPEEFYRFYRDKMIVTGAKPNITHLKLAQWEKEGKLKAVITQNIDGLHQAAGSENVLELHGSVLRNYCWECEEFYPIESIIESEGVPRCSLCNGIIKPDVVLYQEGLNDEVIEKSITAISKAEVLIIAGTSLAVYPAAGLIDYFRGKHLVLINKTSTPQDKKATLLIQAGLGEVFGQMD